MSILVQSEFAASLRNAEMPVPGGVVVPPGSDPARRFGVYRNNVVAGLIKALESRFPVVARLVGPDFFQAMAASFVTDNPPRSPIMFRYGCDFPSFVERFPPASGVPFLPDVARLELARGRAYHAADATPLAASAYFALGADALAWTGLTLHPSVELLASAHPVVSIWRAHQGPGEPRLASWGPEAALVVRPDLDVEVHLLPPGGYAFLTALSQGASFIRAAAVAAVQAPDFDPVGNLALVIESGAGVKLVAARAV